MSCSFRDPRRTSRPYRHPATGLVVIIVSVILAEAFGAWPEYGTALRDDDHWATDGLVGVWPMIQGADSAVLYDYSGNGFHGTISGPTWSGDSLVWSGSNGEAVAIPAVAGSLADLAGAGTIIVKHKPLDGAKVLMGRHNCQMTFRIISNRYALRIDTGTTIAAGANVSYAIPAVSAVTFDDIANQAKFYQDGAHTHTVPSSTDMASSEYPWYVGENPITGAEAPYKGSVEYIILYNRALDVTELASLYEAPSLMFSDPEPELPHESVIYYLDNSATGANNGGPGNDAWQTLAAAQMALRSLPNKGAGDTVIVHQGSGTYGAFNEEDTVVRNDWLTWRAAEGERPQLTNIRVYNGNSEGANPSYLKFQGIDIIGPKATTTLVELKYVQYLYFANCTMQPAYVTIEGADYSWYIGYNQQAVRATACDYVTLDGVRIEYCGIGVNIRQEDGPYCGSNWTIRDSYIGPVAAQGVFLNGDNCTIQDCRLIESNAASMEYYLVSVGGVAGTLTPGETLTGAVSGAKGYYTRTGAPDENRIYLYRLTKTDFVADELVSGKEGSFKLTATGHYTGKPHGESIYVNTGYNNSIIRNYIDAGGWPGPGGTYAISVSPTRVDSPRPILNLRITDNLCISGKEGNSTGSGVVCIRGAHLSEFTGNTCIGGTHNNIKNHGAVVIYPASEYKTDTVIDAFYNNICSLTFKGLRNGYIAKIQSHDNNIFTNDPPKDSEYIAHPTDHSCRFAVAANELVNQRIWDGNYFTDYANMDFTLITGSPAIGAGYPFKTSQPDLLRRKRTSPPDIGCYQYPGLRSHLLSYEYSSDRALDLTKQNKPAVVRNGNTWFSKGQPILDGAADSINCGSDPVLNLTAALTLAAWIYPEHFGASGAARIIDKGADPAGFSLSLNDTNRGLAYRAGADEVLSDPDVITVNQWQHVAVSYSDASDTVTFYVNGQPAGTVSNYQTNPTDSANAPLIIGNNAALTAGFKGMLTDVRIYSRALAADEIKAIYETWEVKENKLVRFDFPAADTDGAPLEFDFQDPATAPPGASCEGNVFTWRPWYNQSGSYEITFEALDQPGFIHRVPIVVENVALQSWYRYWLQFIRKY